jgi:aryl-alcohol dehydrogenase-like predicted oxidoreductase
MRYTRLGQTDLEVSRICFGTWQTGGEWGAVEEREAISAARSALDLGINFFDTAQAYGFGESERMLARSLELGSGSRRDEVVIATKGGLRAEGDAVLRDSSPEWLRKGVEQSLGELGTDHIDLYQVHWPDPDTPFEQTATALDELVTEGKIRYVGVSNFDADEMADFERTRKIDALQPPYHLFRREVEDEILSYASEHRIGVLVYGPLAHGLLTGKFDTEPEFDEGDWRGRSSVFRGEEFEGNLQIVKELGRFAEERGHTVGQLAIAWTLSHPTVDVAIVGARRPDHIEGTAPAGDIELSDDDRQEIEEIIEGAVPVGGPSPEG